MLCLIFLSFLLLSATATPINNLLLARQDKCSDYEFSSGDPAKDKDAWDNTGAIDFLNDFLDRNGAKDWSDNFFKNITAGGTQLGSTFDCGGGFPSDGKCNGPDLTPCKTYNPPETFYIHLAMHNLYAAYSTMHEKLQDNAIIDIASTDQTITQLYGPQPDNASPDIFGLLIGAAVFATLAEGLAGAGGFLIGALNIAAGASKAGSAPTDPNTFRGTLQDASGQIFKDLSDNLEATVKGIFSGEFSGGLFPSSGISDTDLVDTTDNFDERKLGDLDWDKKTDPKVLIKNTFLDGTLIDEKFVDPLVDSWNSKAASYMKDVALRTAWANMEHPISILATKPGAKVTTDIPGCNGVGCSTTSQMDETTCYKSPGRLWDQTQGCLGFAKQVGAPTTGFDSFYFDQGGVDDLTKIIGNYNAALQNALDCILAGSVDGASLVPTGKVDADLTGVTDLKNPPAYPKCFWNLDFTWINA